MAPIEAIREVDPPRRYTLTNVHELEDRRQRRAAYERQRQIAADAMKKAATEFRKLEQFSDARPRR